MHCKYYNNIITQREANMLIKACKMTASYYYTSNLSLFKAYSKLAKYIEESTKQEVELTPVGSPKEV